VARKNSIEKQEPRMKPREEPGSGGVASPLLVVPSGDYKSTWSFKARLLFKMFIDDKQGPIIITVVVEGATGQYLRSVGFP
jgi:hypothetical protein